MRNRLAYLNLLWDLFRYLLLLELCYLPESQLLLESRKQYCMQTRFLHKLVEIAAIWDKSAFGPEVVINACANRASPIVLGGYFRSTWMLYRSPHFPPAGHLWCRAADHRRWSSIIRGGMTAGSYAYKTPAIGPIGAYECAEGGFVKGSNTIPLANLKVFANAISTT